MTGLRWGILGTARINRRVIFVREVERFEASVLDGAPPVVSLAESRRTAVMLSALYASARDTATMYPQ